VSPGKGFLLALAMLAVPILAWIASRWIVRGGSAFMVHARHHALAEWHGTYYAFDDTQVRIYEDAGRLWYVASDVARAVGWPGLPQRFTAAHASMLRRVEGSTLQALDLQGLHALLAPAQERACGRFLNWAQREVEAPWARTKAASGRAP
jgi:hypothetical protein